MKPASVFTTSVTENLKISMPFMYRWSSERMPPSACSRTCRVASVEGRRNPARRDVQVLENALPVRHHLDHDIAGTRVRLQKRGRRHREDEDHVLVLLVAQLLWVSLRQQQHSPEPGPLDQAASVVESHDIPRAAHADVVRDHGGAAVEPVLEHAGGRRDAIVRRNRSEHDGVDLLGSPLHAGKGSVSAAARHRSEAQISAGAFR